jgi:hypothetical protein
LGLLSERRIRAGFTHLNHIAAYGTDITPISIETVLLNCFFLKKKKASACLPELNQKELFRGVFQQRQGPVLM